jgi:Skp family chaperone for outer membrane proteins
LKSTRNAWLLLTALAWLSNTASAAAVESFKVGCFDEQSVSEGTTEATEFSDLSRAVAKQVGEDRATLKKLTARFQDLKDPSQSDKDAILNARRDYQQEKRRTDEALNKLLSKRRSKLLPVLETLSAQRKLPVIIATESVFYINHAQTALVDLTQDLKLQLKDSSALSPPQPSN